MHFITDKQTISDLNLVGKYKTGSMFNLFNRVKSKGGELLLEEMFRSPFTNAAAINKRTSIIKYLGELNINFNIDSHAMESASQYLAEGHSGNLLSAVLVCHKEKIQEQLYRSQKFQILQDHIRSVQEVLQAAGHLLDQLISKEKNNNPSHGMQARLNSIVNVPAFKKITGKKIDKVYQTARCDNLFRNKYRNELEELLRILYEYDVYFSVAGVAASRGLAYAYAQEEEVDREKMIEAKNLKHPALSNAVGNNVDLNRNENLMFLTGANMAGKSTWMKTLGVNFYLAHMGFPVAADAMRFTVMEGIYTSINVPDDISIGWSHFYAEVMRVKLVAGEVSRGKKLFILFDELFKGTNVKDAYDATLAITQRFSKFSDCAFVISTHIIEVGEALMDVQNIQFRYMPTVMKGAVPYYTYDLTDGITSDRQGMIIIRNEKILELLAG